MRNLKHVLITTLMLFFSISIHAQSVTIGDKEFTAHPSAILEMQSTGKGLLVPRLTYTQRMYIQTNAQAAGLLLYQTDREAGFYYFDGLVWKFLAPETTHQLPNFATVAMSGLYADLLNKPELFSGNYEDLTSKPFIPTRLQDLEQDPNYFTTVSRAERERWDAASAGVTFSGSWNDLSDKPVIPVKLSELQQDSDNRTITDAEKAKLASLNNSTFTGSYEDLTEKPFIPTLLRQLQQDDLYAMYVTKAEKDKWNAATHFSGSYTELTEKPFIPTRLLDLEEDPNYCMTVTRAEKEKWNTTAQVNSFSGSWTDLADKPDLAKVALTNEYEDLFGKPTVPHSLEDLAQTGQYRTVTDNEKEIWNGKSSFSGKYADLQGIPDFGKTATSNEYEDLFGKPIIPKSLEDLAQTTYYRTVTDVEKDTWTNKSNFSGKYADLQGAPELHKVAASGIYEDLDGRPKIPTTLAELQPDQYNQRIATSDMLRWDNKSDFSGYYNDLHEKPSFAPVAFSGKYADLFEKPVISDAAATGRYSDLIGIPAWGEWNEISELEIGIQTKIQNSGTAGKFARIDHVHTIANHVPLQNIGTNNQTIVNTAMLHGALISGFGNTDATGSGNGDIISGGYEGGSSKYKLNIRPNVILTGKPTLDNTPNYSDAKTTDYIATTKYLAEELTALKTELAQIRGQEFSKQLPIGTIVMWTGTTNTIPPCWSIADEMAGRFPVGVQSSGGIYQAGKDTDNANKSGKNEVQLSIDEMPSHSHIVGYHNMSNGVGGNVYEVDDYPGDSGNKYTTSTGGNAAHENRPPFYGVYFIKKTSNTCL